MQTSSEIRGQSVGSGEKARGRGWMQYLLSKYVHLSSDQVNFGEGKKGRGGGIQQKGGRIPVAGVKEGTGTCQLLYNFESISSKNEGSRRQTLQRIL